MRSLLPEGHHVRTALLYVSLGLCLVFLFLGGPDYNSSRSYQRTWNLGHVLLFFLVAWIAIRKWPAFFQGPFLRQFVRVLISALTVALIIEWIQAGFDRSFEIEDIWKDLVGSLGAVVFFSPLLRGRSTLPIRIFQTLVLVFIGLEILQLSRAVIDEVIAAQQFPRLATFETPFEVDRWKSRSKLTRDHQIVKEGRFSMRTPLGTDRESRLSLKYFPRDWRHYRLFRCSLFNPSSQAFEAGFRIHDKAHFDSGQAYDDRFNVQFILSPGWNDLAIPLDAVREAPASRDLDLSDIAGVSVLVVKSEVPRIVFVDAVELSQ